MLKHRPAAPQNTLVLTDTDLTETGKLLLNIFQDTPAASTSDSAASVALPLTEAQRELWMAMQMSEVAARSFNDSVSLRLSGPLDTTALFEALQKVVNRHDALRTAFNLTGEYQLISRAAILKMPLTDLSHCDEDQQAASTTEIIAHEVQTCFDFEQAPLLRVHLVKLSDHYHVLLLTTPYIICDGWSLGVVLHELGVLYTALRTGVPSALDTPMQFSEYVDWRARRQAGPNGQMAAAYWTDRFSDAIPILELPTDRPRPAVRSYNGALQTASAGNDLCAELQCLAKDQSSPVFNILLAAFEVWLYRLTCQNDLVVGIRVAGQVPADGHNLVGHCVNFLPLRQNLDKNLRFTEFLSVIQSSVLDACNHQHYTLGNLVRNLHLPRDPSRMPLMSVAFNVDCRTSVAQFSDLRAEVLTNPKPYTHFDIKLNVVETGNGLTMEWYYNTDLFDEATVRRLMGYYETLLAGIVAEPLQRISHLMLMNDAQRHEQLVGWNNTTMNYPREMCFHQLFEAQVEHGPDAVALMFEGGTLSYRELNSRANRLAHHLRTLGVKPDMLVGLCLERSLEMVVALLAILKAGGAYVPLDPAYPAARLAHMLEDAEVAVLITHQKLISGLPPHQARVVCLDDEGALSGAHTNPVSISTAEHLAYVIYTSGSTGKPKGIEITHRALVNFLCAMREQPGLTKQDVLLAVTTLSFDIAGLELLLPLIVGARIVIADRDTAMDGNLLIKQLDTAGITILQATPATWRLLLEAGWQGTPGLKMLCGGEALTRELAEQLLARGAHLWNMYGPTETTVWSLVYQVFSGTGPVPIGRPIANTRLYILDADNQPVPVGVVGELHIGGDGLARGYRNLPRLTAEKFIPDPFAANPDSRLYRTGDLARYLPDGTLECLGRIDHQVKISGYRIELGEIEARLAAYPGVHASVVVVREDVPGDKYLMAYVVTRTEIAVNPDDLRDFLKQSLPAYMMPAAIILLPALPLMPNGKIDRNALPISERTTGNRNNYLAPRNPLEFQLTRLWEKLLRITPIGIHDDFFVLGGNSLLAMRLIAWIEKSLRIKLPLVTLFHAPTIAQLAGALAQEAAPSVWSSLVPMQLKGSKPPLFFAPGTGGNLLQFRNLVKDIGTEQPFFGLQPEALDGIQAPLTCIEDMAAHYLKVIRTVQPEGPYYLGGWCLGAVVIFEMAQQLLEQGESVGAPLIMIDPADTVSESSEAVPLGYDRLKLHKERLAHLTAGAKIVYLFKRVHGKIKVMLLRGRDSLIRICYKSSIYFGRPVPVRLREKYVIDADEKALMNYVPKSYAGKIILLLASQELGTGNYEPREEWIGRAQGGMEVYLLNGNHKTVFHFPHVLNLAEKIRTILLSVFKVSKPDEIPGSVVSAAYDVPADYPLCASSPIAQEI
ncbi:MAG: amino acid adenylation domain-containing protein [Gammaproteobacteria bacterium]